MTFDAHFKQLLRDFLQGCTVRAGVEIGKLPLAIDMEIGCEGVDTGGIEIPIFRRGFKVHNIIEYKSSHGHPRAEDMAKLVGYAGLYGEQAGLGIGTIMAEMTAWYFTAAKPAFISELVDAGLLEPTEDHGVYRFTHGFPCEILVVVIAELDIEEGNIPLLGFATDDRLTEIYPSISRVRREAGISPRLERYLTDILVLKHEVLKNMAEAIEDYQQIVRRNIKEVIEDLGVKEVIQAIGLKAFIDAAGVDRIVDEIGVDALKAILARAEQQKKKTKSGKSISRKT
jgi:hypothetical protein